MDIRKIYGAKRDDYSRYSDFVHKKNGVPYEASEAVFGYFQLYALPLKTRASYDASRVDIDFRELFFWWEVLPDLTVAHLGSSTNNWKGRESALDFLMDNPDPATEG